MARVLKKNWHEVFAECVLPHTDAPANFITWAGLSFIGAALKNHVFFEISTYTLYPNMFVVLVAPPGIGKGTAMNIITGMNNENKLNKIVNTLSDRITAEKIIETIADGWSAAPHMAPGGQMIIPSKEHSCLLFAEELRTLLGASEWMLTFLEQAWSQTTFDYQTKNKGSVFIDNMCCSLLAASVPDFLRNVNREASMVITGGFSSRCLFVYAETPSQDNTWLEPLKKNKKSTALWDNLILDLKEITKLRGEFTADTAARIHLDLFLKRMRVSVTSEESEAIANFKARLKAHALKLAMIFSASRGDSLIINQFDMVNATGECEKVIQNLNKLFRGAGESMDAAGIARVQSFIEKHGPTSKREIFKALYRHLTQDDLERILWVIEYLPDYSISMRGKINYYEHKPLTKKAGP